MTNKQLHDALVERVKRMAAAAEGGLRVDLEKMNTTLVYSAPELAPGRAAYVRGLLETQIGDPRRFADWRASVADIWQEPWPE